MEEIKKKRVSYSQYSTWCSCSHRWKLDYALGLRKFDASINTCFGTAIHVAVQTYIKALYTEGVVVADKLEIYKLFKSEFEKELNKVDADGKKIVTYTDDEYTEFVYDGEDIIKAFLDTSTRIKHFPSNKYELIGVEVPLKTEIKNNLDFVAYLDLVLKDKTGGNIKILDFKTAFNGWNQYQRADQTKLEQLLLYKAVYSKLLNVPLEKIEVEFFILKRRLYENVSFPQSRIQQVKPTQNKPIITKTLNNFIEFINSCFSETGEYKLDGEYFKNPGNGKKNCKYCKHYKTVNCDGKEEKD